MRHRILILSVVLIAACGTFSHYYTTRDGKETSTLLYAYVDGQLLIELSVIYGIPHNYTRIQYSIENNSRDTVQFVPLSSRVLSNRYQYKQVDESVAWRLTDTVQILPEAELEVFTYWTRDPSDAIPSAETLTVIQHPIRAAGGSVISDQPQFYTRK